MIEEIKIPLNVAEVFKLKAEGSNEASELAEEIQKSIQKVFSKFKCVSCNNILTHKDLETAVVKISKNRKGVVFVCNNCTSLNKEKNRRN